MVTVSKRRGFTLVELLVVITIIGTLMGLLFPAINGVMATVRNVACQTNMRNMGQALKTFEADHHYYPPSCAFTKGPAAAAQTSENKPASANQKYESWSWIAYLLPYLDRRDEYNQLNKCGGGAVPWQELDPNGPPRIQQVRETTLGFLLCPAQGRLAPYTGAPLKGFLGAAPGDNSSMSGALTSYKCLGGSVKESLPLRVNPRATPPYGSAGDHPDGVMFPSSNTEGVGESGVEDSQSQTIMLTETLETKYSRWLIGTEATVAGLPSANDPAGGPITLNTQLNLYAPAGFDGTFGVDSKIPDKVKTYLGYDYMPVQNMYDAVNGVKYGPSSKHNGSVNHLFVDGVARPIKSDIDVAAYMFLITRKGHEVLGSYGDAVAPAK